MNKRNEVHFKWKCPRCGAPANAHGKGGMEKCQYDSQTDSCQGFICECDNEGSDGHGELLSDPCPGANCYHCGWGGVFPTAPKGIETWEKKALEAGWSPPPSRAKELNKK